LFNEYLGIRSAVAVDKEWFLEWKGTVVKGGDKALPHGVTPEMFVIKERAAVEGKGYDGVDVDDNHP